MSDKEIIEALKLYFDEVEINITSLYRKLGKKNYNKFDAAYREIYKND